MLGHRDQDRTSDHAHERHQKEGHANGSNDRVILSRQAELADHPEDGIWHAEMMPAVKITNRSDAVLVDLLTEPHQEHAAGGDAGQTSHHEEESTGGVRFQHGVHHALPRM